MTSSDFKCSRNQRFEDHDIIARDNPDPHGLELGDITTELFPGEQIQSTF